MKMKPNRSHQIRKVNNRPDTLAASGYHDYKIKQPNTIKEEWLSDALIITSFHPPKLLTFRT